MTPEQMLTELAEAVREYTGAIRSVDGQTLQTDGDDDLARKFRSIENKAEYILKISLDNFRQIG